MLTTQPAPVLPDDSLIKVGGRGRSIRFVVDDQAPLSDVQHELLAYLDSTGGFFRGARVGIDVGQRMAFPQEIASIISLLEGDYGLLVGDLRSESERLETGLSQAFGLRVSVLPPRLEPYREGTLVVKGACRSGSVVHHEGDVVVLGDINPGAEVTAAGDITVFGAIRGSVGAGVNGDYRAVVIALSLSASQLRIGRLVRVDLGQPSKKKRRHLEPQIARVRNGQIAIEAYDGQLLSS